MSNMIETFTIFPIGYIKRTDDEVQIEILKKFIPALKQLEHFSHVQILWWANKVDNEEQRNKLDCVPPYGKNPPITGVFATRAEYRPNPIALTTAKILNVDHESGLVKIQNIDAIDNTPVLDLKAYFPVCDRVREAFIPDWIVGWPDWLPEEGLGLQ
ncbi:MAG: tRNA (N6-threonylcarbamoyladenosine(37)-N6)-methyltransferase TrmO [Candidatus Heimdallarchaeota archaeon]|nr:MAG: tRNA (N6-threonylcarbamoyladenosine(37)-N6)-methyltransferase TrmO [Candidatus Heimdallarchaeota archaeon]